MKLLPTYKQNIDPWFFYMGTDWGIMYWGTSRPIFNPDEAYVELKDPDLTKFERITRETN